MEVAAILSYEEFLSLEKDWKYIIEKSDSDNIFISWEWYSLWMKHFHSNKKILILKVRDKGEIIGIAPFMLEEGNLFTLRKSVIRFLSDDMMADYMDFVILRDNKEVIKEIFSFLIGENSWGRIDLKRITEYSPNFNALKEVLAEIDYPFLIRVDCVSPVVEIGGVWEDYHKSLAKNFKKDIRNSLNRLHRLGEVCFEEGNKHSLDLFFKGLCEMHKKSQKNKPGISIFESQSNRDFLYELDKIHEGIDISVLKVNDRIIACQYALKYHGIISGWITTFDTKYSRNSPGNLLMMNLIKMSFSEGYKKFDFMIGDEWYKLRFAKKTFNNYEIKIYEKNLFYKLDMIKIKVRNYFRDVKNKHAFLQMVWLKLSKIDYCNI
ncbi:MAG: GNAT family N-acetyltransferase [bacterium]|nr:GNAT family N-acetyltransferase [bacterium]